jgi:uncharacterized protein (DUF433 family)
VYKECYIEYGVKIMTKATKQIVSEIAQVRENIERYRRSLSKHPKLRARIGQHPAWYAAKGTDGGWRFGPSKFVGYAGNTAEYYLAPYSRTDGKETEPALREWFKRVEEDSPLWRELRHQFKVFAAGYGKVPHKNWRVSVARQDLGSEVKRSHADSERKAISRIVADPEICGGRPSIRGTRMRVSDVVDLIAGGADRAEILADYPYLADEDITAALEFASRAVDHRIVRAA